MVDAILCRVVRLQFRLQTFLILWHWPAPAYVGLRSAYRRAAATRELAQAPLSAKSGQSGPYQWKQDSHKRAAPRAPLASPHRGGLITTEH
jgi:hypothetical protein